MKKHYLHYKSKEVLLLDKGFSNESDDILKLYPLNKNKKIKSEIKFPVCNNIEYKHFICLKKNLVDLEFIFKKIKDFKFEYSYGNIHIVNDIYLDYDFIIDEIKNIQGGSVNTGFGIEYELLKDVSYDVEFNLCSEYIDEIETPYEWDLEIKKQLLISYE